MLTEITTTLPSLGSDLLLTFLVQMSVLLVTATLLGRLAARFGLPAVVGELSAGLLLGPTLLSGLFPEVVGTIVPGTADQVHLIDIVGQLGVLFLVGITGCHLDLANIRSFGRTAGAVSGFGLVVPLAAGVAMGFYLPKELAGPGIGTPVFATFVGISLCVSAIPVIAKILGDLGAMHRDVAQLTLAAGMIDDVFGWFALSLISSVATTGLTTGSVATGAGALLVVLAVAFAIRPLARRLFAMTNRTPDAAPTIVAAAVVIMLSAAGTAGLHLEAVMGAFVAGAVIGEWGRPDPRRLAPLRTVTFAVLAPVFFATCGLRVDLTALARPDFALVAAAVVAVAILGKFIGAWLGARTSGLRGWPTLALGAGMNARGVVEIVIGMVGLRVGIISQEMFTIVVLVAVVTSLMAPPILTVALRRIPVTEAELARQRAQAGLIEEPGVRPLRAAPEVGEEDDPPAPSRAA